MDPLPFPPGYYLENVAELPLRAGSGEFRVVRRDDAEGGWATRLQFAPTAADGPPGERGPQRGCNESGNGGWGRCSLSVCGGVCVARFEPLRTLERFASFNRAGRAGAQTLPRGIG